MYIGNDHRGIAAPPLTSFTNHRFVKRTGENRSAKQLFPTAG
jgi:hypothetical protein